MTYYEPSLYPDPNPDISGGFASPNSDPYSDEVVLDCLNMLAASIDLDTATDSFLETLGCFYCASAAYVFEVNPSGSSFSRRFAWYDPERIPLIPATAPVPVESIQIWIDMFESEGTLCLSAGDWNLTPVDLFHPAPPASIMAAPLYVNTNLSGFLCVIDPTLHFGDMKVLLAVASLTVVELRKLHLMQELEYLHRKDPLTDVYNRFSYVESLAKNYQSPPASMGVIAASVNGLKAVNTVLGDKFGDTVVQRTAEIMRETLCTDVYRIGGDEFLSMFPNISNEEFQSLLNAVQKAFSEESGCSVATGSAWAGEQMDLNSLIIEADKQLLTNKASLRKD